MLHNQTNAIFHSHQQQKARASLARVEEQIRGVRVALQDTALGNVIDERVVASKPTACLRSHVGHIVAVVERGAHVTHHGSERVRSASTYASAPTRERTGRRPELRGEAHWPCAL